MFSYYLKLALYNIKRAAFINFLVVLTIAIGVGLVSTNLTLINTMTSNPLAHKSDRMFHVSMNTWPNDSANEQPLYVLRYREVKAILDYQGAKNKFATYQTGTYVRSETSETLKRYQANIRAASVDFFALSEAPFKYGSGFESNHSRHVVISDKLNMRLFNGENSVGKNVEFEGQLFTISGVLKPWNLRPLYYHLTDGRAFNDIEDIFMPLETAIDTNLYPYARSTSSEGIESVDKSRDKSIYFYQAWIEFERPEQVKDFQNYLDNYSQQLKDGGEHPNEIINELNDLDSWLIKQELVDDQVVALLVASLLFLVVCIFNASSLLLSRFHAAKFEIGLRRAIGANKMHLLQQNLIECIILGVIAGVCALILSWVFLEVSIMFLPHLENLAFTELKLHMAGMFMAVLTAVLSALYPMYRMNRYSISAELKG